MTSMPKLALASITGQYTVLKLVRLFPTNVKKVLIEIFILCYLFYELVFLLLHNDEVFLM